MCKNIAQSRLFFRIAITDPIFCLFLLIQVKQPIFGANALTGFVTAEQGGLYPFAFLSLKNLMSFTPEMLFWTNAFCTYILKACLQMVNTVGSFIDRTKKALRHSIAG